MQLVTRHSSLVTARPRRALVTRHSSLVTRNISYLLSFICYLLSAALCAAADPGSTTYPLYIGGIQFTDENLAIDNADNPEITSGKAEYDPASHTLTLTKFAYEGTGVKRDFDTAALLYYGTNDLVIVLHGDNRLKLRGTADCYNNVAAFTGNYGPADFTVTIKSTDGGKLSLIGGKEGRVSYGMYSNGDVVFTGACVSAVGGDGNAGKSYGVFCENGGSITLKDGALTAIGGSAQSSGYGISAPNSTFAAGGISVEGGWLVAQGPTMAVENTTLSFADGFAVFAGESAAVATPVTGNGWQDRKFVLVSAITPVSTWNDLDAALKAGGAVLLTADVTPDNPLWADALTVPSDVYSVLDLNGHIVDRGYREQGYDGSVIKVEGALILRDGDSTVDHGGTVSYADPLTGASAAVNGGVLTGGWPEQYGGGIYVGAGVVNMQGGSIVGNHAGKGGFAGVEGLGGGVYIQSGTFDMSGGAICGNSAIGSSFGTSLGRGGGVYVRNGAFTLSNGLIAGNVAGKLGGGVYASSASSASDGSFSVSGRATVTDNALDGAANNVHLEPGGLITVAGTLTGTLGITMQAPGTFTAGLPGNGATANFTSDDTAYDVFLTDAGEAQLVSPVTYLDSVGGTNALCTAYTAYAGENTLTSGWWVVVGAITNGTRIKVSGDVNLILMDGAELAATKGINVAVEGGVTNSLTIWAQCDATVDGSNAGKLIATCGDGYQAGIGGGNGDTGNGGTADAGNAGAITINGGEIMATCSTGSDGAMGAGIGGGSHGAAGEITINGGKVAASCTASDGTAYGAGIGGGLNGAGGAITINGGTVAASCGADTGAALGAGIGCGQSGTCDAVAINGGEVTATCGTDNGAASGAGIGSGLNGTCGTVTIAGGKVTASCSTGGDDHAASGAGIGGGSSGGSCGMVVISGGKVSASCVTSGAGAGANGAGIGGGFAGSCGAVAIVGGEVTATCATSGSNAIAFGAGIGGGIYGDGGDVTISNGTVTAGSSSGTAVGAGAGIGGGYQGAGGATAIVGGVVTARGNTAIGGGLRSGGNGTLSIDGVKAGYLENDGEVRNWALFGNREGYCQNTDSKTVRLVVCFPHEYEGADCLWCGAASPLTSVAAQTEIWNPMAQISFTLTRNVAGEIPAGASPRLVLSATDTATGTNAVADTAAIGVDADALLGSNGTYTVSWNLTGAFGEGFTSTGVVFTVAYRYDHEGSERTSCATSSAPVEVALMKSFAPNDIVLTDCVAVYDGAAHTIGISTNAIPGLTLRYCVTDGNSQFSILNSQFSTSSPPQFANVTNVTVWVEASATGYFTTTNSATVKITKAANAWITAPSMKGWTAGATPATPNKGKAKFGTATVAYGKAGGAAGGLGAKRPSAAGSYVATFTVAATANYGGLVKNVSFSIKAKPKPPKPTPTPKPKTYKVKFSANGGTLPKGKSMAAQTFTTGKAKKLRGNAFVRDGYVFLGWSKRKDGPVAFKNGQKVKNLAKAGKTVTLYAAWAKDTYIVLFDASGGRGKMQRQTFTNGESQNLNKNRFIRKGYVFGGWAIRDPLATIPKIKYKDKQMVKNLSPDGRTVTLYAVWKRRR